VTSGWLAGDAAMLGGRGAARSSEEGAGAGAGRLGGFRDWSASRRNRAARTSSRRSSFGRRGGSPALLLNDRRVSVSRLPITPRLLPTPRSGAGYESFRANDERIVVSAWMFSIR
jgi:hypothetical protein